MVGPASHQPRSITIRPDDLFDLHSGKTYGRVSSKPTRLGVSADDPVPQIP